MGNRSAVGLLLLVLFAFPAAAQIEGNTWFPIGPAPISGFFKGGATGRASAIVVNPMNKDEIWLGTAGGGVWHTRDAGQNWEPMSDREDGLAVGAVALDGCTASGCARIFAGTGENAIRRDTYYGHGLLIGTTSGGEFPTFSWSHITGNPFDWRFTSINNIVFDPNSNAPNKPIYVTVSSGVTVASAESTVTVPTPASVFGIYRSTNGGTTWEKLNVPGAANAQPSDLKMHPSNPMILYAGFLGRGVFRSMDGGNNWCPMNQGVPPGAGCPAQDLPNVSLPFDFVKVAFAPSSTDTIYATFGRCADRLLQNCIPAIWRTTNAGADWTELHAGAPNDGFALGAGRSYSRYTHALAVDPANADTLIVGGVKLVRFAAGPNTFSFTDTNTAPGTGDAVLHYDHRDVVFAPGDPLRVYNTNDGGFAVSFDGGLTWTPRNDDLQITGFHGLGHSILPHVGMIIGASQDNAAQTWNGGRQWTHRANGDGSYAFMDWDTAMRMYEGFNDGKIRRSDNGGMDFFEITPATSEPRLFYAPFVQGPSAIGAEHPLYWGSHRLWRSVTNGDSWTDVSPVLAFGSFPDIVTALDHTTNPMPGVNVLTAIGIAPNNANRIYIGYYGGEVFATSNNPNAPCAMNNCWNATDTDPPDAPVTDIAVDPTNADVAYATFSGFSTEPKVWKTTNRGADWVAMSIGLPPGIPANTVSIEPATASTPQRIYVGMDSGPNGSSVFRSTDGGATWAAFSTGLPNVPVYEISIDTVHGRIYAATHGRGAWVLGRAFISNYEGWVNGSIWDIPVFGQNFLPNQGSCTMQILQTDGTVCASSTIDQMGGTIRTDPGGVLETSLASMWNNRRVVWACYNGNCINSTPIAECNDDEDGDGDPDLLSTIVVSCGGHVAIGRVTGAPPLDNPPETLLGLGLLGIPTVFSASELTAEATMPRRAAATAGVLHLTTIVQRPVGTQSLCTVAVPFAADDSDLAILERAQNAVNASPTCAANRVQAILDRGLGGESEDEFPRPPRLRLRAPGVTGSQLITGIHVQPSSGTGTCFQVSGIGVPVLNQTQVLKILMVTPPGGAAGGNVTITEESPVGACEITVPTFAGQTRQQLADAVVAAFQAPGIPGPHPRCPADRNLRDASSIGGGVVTVFASMLEVCTTDPNIGFDIRPKELLNVHPVAEAGDDRVVPSGMPVALSAAASFDPDSTPGTRDDIASYEWFDVTSGAPVLLGSSDMLNIPLTEGLHRIRVRVTDKAGLADTDETVLDVGGVSGGGSAGRWLGSFHVGSTHPLGNLASVSDANIHLRADVGYRLTRRARLLAFGGFSQLTAETAAAIPHPRFINASLNGQFLFPLASGTDFYLEGGPGVYWRKSGGSNFGFNLGLGFQLPITGPYRIELGADYHRVAGPPSQFITVQLGVLFR
jgi:photosystem II stability/assembly factor-like uncharacterized protein